MDTVKANRPAGGERNRAEGNQNNQQDALAPVHQAIDRFREYAKENPDVAALWVFGIGFVLGWKLKPW